MKYKTGLISLLILLLLSAFAQNPRPLFALPLPEGRTLDEGHDLGYIDWSGSVGYINLNHKDGICPSGCVEQVTRIHDGSAVSGSFAPVDVVYFEVMVAFTHNSGAGTAVLNACGSSDAWYLYVGPGSGLPGFVSMPLSVPSGCTSWSLSASGGYVDFRSVDANYSSPPPPVSTDTFTPIPTETFTPTLTATETLTPTATETLAPIITPSDTPTPSYTPSLTATSTPIPTLPPGATPSDTPVPPMWTNTSAPLSSSGGQDGNGSFVLPTVTFTQTAVSRPAHTSTAASALEFVSATPNLVETARVMIFGTATPTPTPKPVSRAGKSGQDFPWWLLLAGGAAIGGALLKRYTEKRASLATARPISGTQLVTRSLPNASPPTTSVHVPRYVSQIVQDGWKTITERTPRFITQTVQNGWKTVTERVPHFITQTVQDGWKTVTERVPRFVTQTVQQGYKTIVQPVTEWVSRTIWEPIKKWIPGLGWLADKVKKTVVEPVTRFVTKTVPNFVTKTVQAGWNFVTKTVPNFVTKTVQAGWDFVTKTVPSFVTRTVQAGWNFVTKTVPHFVTKTTQTGWEYLQQTRQSLDDLWHRRSVRIALAATAIAVTAPTFFTSVNLATYQTFHVPAVTWFGVGSENRGVETALANQTAIRDVANNYNAAIVSGTTFTCEYNQKGKPRKECARSVEIQPILVEAAISVQSQWKIPWLDSSLLRWIQGREHSSEGIAQVSQPELEQWADNLKKYLPPGASLSPQDAHASAGAVIERIAPVLEYCWQQNCDANSQVIVAAMAQNGKGFTVESLKNIYDDSKYLNQDGNINWEEYFADQGLRPIEGSLPTRISQLVQNLRAMPGNFERQFMLQLYVNDLKLLQAKGETLPEGVDLKYLECLADRLPGASYHCESGKEN